MIADFVTIASLTAPIRIGTTPGSLLWLLPLVASIAVAYKATKLPTITLYGFIREAVILFGSIVIFMAVIAVALFAVVWLILR